MFCVPGYQSQFQPCAQHSSNVEELPGQSPYLSEPQRTGEIILHTLAMMSQALSQGDQTSPLVTWASGPRTSSSPES